MRAPPCQTALIVGAGPGISAALTRRLAAEGVKVALAARDVAKLADLVSQTGARTFTVEAADPAGVEAMFAAVETEMGAPDLVVYNPSRRVRGALVTLDPWEVRDALGVTAFGAFLVVQQAARRMVPRGTGTIILTGASAGLKGYPLSAPFAMGKFALRGLAQSAARELGPQGIHVAHVVVDGVVREGGETDDGDEKLDPDAIAQTYLDLAAQSRSAWSLEVDLRPWTERF